MRIPTTYMPMAPWCLHQLYNVVAFRNFGDGRVSEETRRKNMHSNSMAKLRRWFCYLIECTIKCHTEIELASKCIKSNSIPIRCTFICPGENCSLIFFSADPKNCCILPITIKLTTKKAKCRRRRRSKKFRLEKIKKKNVSLGFVGWLNGLNPEWLLAMV